MRQRLPPSVLRSIRSLAQDARRVRWKLLGRQPQQAETSKAKPRREREHFFELYCQGHGLDIGHGGDKIVDDVRGWDLEDGDAQFLVSLADESFDFVYSSHTLEHMADPSIALQNWWRVIRPGGFLIVSVPHRDLYEKKKDLPSRWNADHKFFFLPEEDEAPVTIGVRGLIEKSISQYKQVYLKVCNEGWVDTGPEKHPVGEFSIECILQKN